LTQDKQSTAHHFTDSRNSDNSIQIPEIPAHHFGKPTEMASTIKKYPSTTFRVPHVTIEPSWRPWGFEKSERRTDFLEQVTFFFGKAFLARVRQLLRLYDLALYILRENRIEERGRASKHFRHKGVVWKPLHGVIE
jgi:hypothetical protein